MATKTTLEVPADPKWRHVIAATVLAAAGVGQGRRAAEFGLNGIGEMGDLSLLLDRALDSVDGWAGVTRLLIEVGTDHAAATVTVIGQGEDVEAPSWPEQEWPEQEWPEQERHPAFIDPLTGSRFLWSPTALTCSFRVTAPL